jgi:antitoxin component YwqK of YwqJK toxin-antitoxin module
MCVTFLPGCKPYLINQKIQKKKQGVWIEEYSEDSTHYKSYEYYKDDQPVKKWKSYSNGKIYKTEKYKNGICTVKYYHQNGKLQSKGKTNVEIDSVETHWFYFGKWKFYSDKGKLTDIRKYNKGELVSEQSLE